MKSVCSVPKSLLKLSLIQLLLFIVVCLNAQEVGVFVRRGVGIPLHQARVGEKLILTELENYTDFDTVAGTELTDRIRAAGGDPELLAACGSTECAADAARLSGVSMLLLTEFARDGGAYLLRVIAVDSEGVLIARTEERVFDIRDLDELVAAAGTALAVGAGLITAPVVAEVLEPPLTVAEEEASLSDAATITPSPEDEESPPASAAERVTAPVPFTPQESRRQNLFTASLVMLPLGGLGNMLTLYSDIEGITNYYMYLGASEQEEIDRYYNEYENYHLAARVAGVSAYTFTLGAPLAAGYALFSGEPSKLGYTRRGRHFYYAGLAGLLAGNLLYLGAMDALVESSYLRARSGNDDDPLADYYGTEYDRVFTEALLTEAAVLGLWGLGSAALIAAPLQEGRRTPLAPNFWDKVLVSSGVLLLSGGNVMASLAGFRRTDAEEAYYKYLRADEDIQARYDRVDEEFDAYYLAGGLAAGFWIGGAVCFAAAELFDFPDPFPSRGRSGGNAGTSGEKSLLGALRLIPHPEGAALYVHFDL